MEYKEFLKTKEKTFISSGFDIDEKELKESYFSLNAKNHKDIVLEKSSNLTLF